MRNGKMLVAAFGAALLIAAPAEAQMRTVTFGVAAGPSLPIGDLGDHFNTGWHVQGSFALAPMTLPFGVRADLNYQRFPEKAHDDHSIDMLSGIVNGIFALPGVNMRPYLTAGVGAYNTSFDDHDDDNGNGSTTDIGINGGAGVQFGLGALNAFLEAKFHNVFSEGSATRFIPVSIGIMF
jgi:opacity protein-like surface antigen